MSTRAIRDVIRKLGESMIGPQREALVSAALAEVEAIEKAARAMQRDCQDEEWVDGLETLKCIAEESGR